MISRKQYYRLILLALSALLITIAAIGNFLMVVLLDYLFAHDFWLMFFVGVLVSEAGMLGCMLALWRVSIVPRFGIASILLIVFCITWLIGLTATARTRISIEPLSFVMLVGLAGLIVSWFAVSVQRRLAFQNSKAQRASLSKWTLGWSNWFLGKQNRSDESWRDKVDQRYGTGYLIILLFGAAVALALIRRLPFLNTPAFWPSDLPYFILGALSYTLYSVYLFTLCTDIMLSHRPICSSAKARGRLLRKSFWTAIALFIVNVVNWWWILSSRDRWEAFLFSLAYSLGLIAASLIVLWLYRLAGLRWTGQVPALASADLLDNSPSIASDVDVTSSTTQSAPAPKRSAATNDDWDIE